MEKRYDMICDSCGKLHCADDGTLRRDEYGSPLCSTCEDWILTAIEEPVVLATAYDSLTAEVADVRKLLDHAEERGRAMKVDSGLYAAIQAEQPEKTIEINYRLRKYIALSHEDGKCYIYGDDGELQCNNLLRHGRCLDFLREPISDLLDAIETCRMQEYAESQAAIREGKEE